MPSVLESVVLQLTARREVPGTGSVQRWVEEASSRWSPAWRDSARFSLVIRTAPLGEWIYWARAGRTDPGELFIEYYRRHEESTTYLATPVNRGEQVTSTKRTL
ncbi:hypothetical protein FS837_002616 [Tulasnella sp. UAMH 9824]|nr:hypothetical protein FS837_002616 [Tulasnella sp. UAMH 9824]